MRKPLRSSTNTKRRVVGPRRLLGVGALRCRRWTTSSSLPLLTNTSPPHAGASSRAASVAAGRGCQKAPITREDQTQRSGAAPPRGRGLSTNPCRVASLVIRGAPRSRNKSAVPAGGRRRGWGGSNHEAWAEEANATIGRSRDGAAECQPGTTRPANNAADGERHAAATGAAQIAMRGRPQSGCEWIFL